MTSLTVLLPSVLGIIMGQLLSSASANECFEENESGIISIPAESTTIKKTRWHQVNTDRRSAIQWTNLNLRSTRQHTDDLVYNFICPRSLRKAVFLMSFRTAEGRTDLNNDAWVSINDDPAIKVCLGTPLDSGTWKYSTCSGREGRAHRQPIISCQEGENTITLSGTSKNYRIDYILLAPESASPASLDFKMPPTNRTRCVEAGASSEPIDMTVTIEPRARLTTPATKASSSRTRSMNTPTARDLDTSSLNIGSRSKRGSADTETFESSQQAPTKPNKRTLSGALLPGGNSCYGPPKDAGNLDRDMSDSVAIQMQDYKRLGNWNVKPFPGSEGRKFIEWTGADQQDEATIRFGRSQGRLMYPFTVATEGTYQIYLSSGNGGHQRQLSFVWASIDGAPLQRLYTVFPKDDDGFRFSYRFELRDKTQYKPSFKLQAGRHILSLAAGSQNFRIDAGVITPLDLEMTPDRTQPLMVLAKTSNVVSC